MHHSVPVVVYRQYVPLAYTGTVALITWALAVLFCAWYTWDALYYKVENPWWKTQMGRNMFSLAGTIALTLLPSVLFKLFRINIITASWQWYTAVVFTLCVPILAHRLGYGILLRVRDQRAFKQVKRQEEAAPTAEQ